MSETIPVKSIVIYEKLVSHWSYSLPYFSDAQLSGYIRFNEDNFREFIIDDLVRLAENLDKQETQVLEEKTFEGGIPVGTKNTALYKGEEVRIHSSKFDSDTGILTIHALAEIENVRNGKDKAREEATRFTDSVILPGIQALKEKRDLESKQSKSKGFFARLFE